MPIFGQGVAYFWARFLTMGAYFWARVQSKRRFQRILVGSEKFVAKPLAFWSVVTYNKYMVDTDQNANDDEIHRSPSGTGGTEMTTTNTAAPKTQRRTAKISQSARGYVAIQCDHIAAKTTRIACVAKCDMEIKGSNGASVTIKAGEAFWLVRSESLGDNWFYIVREVVGEKRCSCPANKPCKHEVALKAHIAEHGKPAIHLRATERRAELAKAKAAEIVGGTPEYTQRFAELQERQENEARRVSERNLAALGIESTRRIAAPINGSRMIGFAPIVAPVLAVSRAVPMR